MNQDKSIRNNDTEKKCERLTPEVDMKSLILMMNISKEDFIINVSFGKGAEADG